MGIALLIYVVDPLEPAMVLLVESKGKLQGVSFVSTTGISISTQR